MGCLGSKDRLSKEDMEFLKTHTRYDEVTIKEWYKGFKVTFSPISRRRMSNTKVTFQITARLSQWSFNTS